MRKRHIYIQVYTNKVGETYFGMVRVMKEFNSIDQEQAQLEEANNHLRLKAYATMRESSEKYLIELDKVIELDTYSAYSDKLKLNFNRVKECGSYLWFRNYYMVGVTKLSRANFCGVHLLCPFCAARRCARTVKNSIEKFEAITKENENLKLSLITFTIKNGDDLEERLNHIKYCMKVVHERGNKTKKKTPGYHSEFGKILGMIGSIEVTKNSDKETGWHVHIHAIALHDEELSRLALQQEWLKISKDSHILELETTTNSYKEFYKIITYATKVDNLTAEQRVELFKATRPKKRLLFTSGIFWGVEVESKSTSDAELIKDMPYVEEVFRYWSGKYVCTSRQNSLDIINEIKINHELT